MLCTNCKYVRYLPLVCVTEIIRCPMWYIYSYQLICDSVWYEIRQEVDTEYYKTYFPNILPNRNTYENLMPFMGKLCQRICNVHASIYIYVLFTLYIYTAYINMQEAL